MAFVLSDVQLMRIFSTLLVLLQYNLISVVKLFMTMTHNHSFLKYFAC